MTQIVDTVMSEGPGVLPSKVCERLCDYDAARLLPPGAFQLIASLDPSGVNGPSRAETLGRVLSLELAVDDSERRTILLRSVPKHKVRELEDRTGTTVDQLCREDQLESSVRRALLGFFGTSTRPDEIRGFPDPVRTILPQRGLFPHQKRAASALNGIYISKMAA